MGETTSPNDSDKALGSVNDKVTNFKPADFLSSNERIATKALTVLKSLYDLTKCTETVTTNGKFLNFKDLNPLKRGTKKKRNKKAVSSTEIPLQSLVVEDFDENQIWEELQLQNVLIYDNLVSSVSKLLAHKNYEKRHESEEEEDYDDNLNDGEELGDDELDEDEEDEEKSKAAAKKYPKSIVDDNFFNLAQMTEFLEQQESRIDRSDEDDSESDDDEEREEEDDLDEEEDDNDDDVKAEEIAKVYYRHFFDPPHSSSKTRKSTAVADKDAGENHIGRKMVRFSLGEDEDNEANASEEDEDEEENPNLIPIKPWGNKLQAEPEVKIQSKIEEDGKTSSFEKRRKNIESNIESIEAQALEPKSWQLTGEVTAESRPENSLLEEHLVYDHLIRQAPEITAETTQRLEDIIKQRIKDMAWDDVERKVKPVEDANEFKKRLVLNAEKSKMSLAQIYEQEYIDKKKAEDGEVEEETEPEQHIAIKNAMSKLFPKLDALCNYHYTPKSRSAEVKIVVNLPAISMEEVAPVSVSDATLLAPQEILSNVKKAIKGKTERTETDKKRERRSKKKQQKLKRIGREERDKIKSLGLRNVKIADNVKSKKKTKLDNEIINLKELKSSKAFFERLQKQAEDQVKDVASKRKAATPKETSSKKFKL